jgi:transcriptional regulator with XRE-family HTH domain
MDSRFIAVDGAKLRKLRRERALSQQDIERGTGISQATLSDLEQGKRGARTSTLRKLARYWTCEPRTTDKGGVVSNTNGHTPKRAILYAASQVRTEEEGYSLLDQRGHFKRVVL